MTALRGCSASVECVIRLLAALRQDLAFYPRFFFIFVRMHQRIHHCPIKYSDESWCQELDISLYHREAPTTPLVSSSSLVLFFLLLHCMNCSLMYSHYFGSASPLGLPQCEGSTHHTDTHTPLHKKHLKLHCTAL